MKISVDASLCEGYGNCARIAPELFALDDAGYSEVRDQGDVPPDRETVARHAVDDCPMAAIRAAQ